MRNKWFRRIRWFIELFTAGGSIYSKSGIEARVSHYGGFEVPQSERWKLVDLAIKERARLEAMWRREREAAKITERAPQ